MKTRNFKTFLAVMVACHYALLLADDPIPTNRWTQFGSENCLINGNPSPQGVIIQAFDNTAVLCGSVTGFEIGKYTMPVYGDDPFSALVDEGCILSENVVFKVNGRLADELGPANDLWEDISPIKIMNLSITQTFAMTLTGLGEGMGKAGETVSYFVTLKNTGDGIDSISLSGTNDLGWTVTGFNPTGDYMNPNAETVYEIQVHIPPGATFGQQDTLTLTAVSVFDGSATASKKIITTVDQTTGVDGGGFTVPGVFELFQNFPNPFNPETVIAFNLEKSANVTLSIYDILGRRIATLENRQLGVGAHNYRWYGLDQNGEQVSSGVYFYRLTSAEFSITRKMALLK